MVNGPTSDDGVRNPRHELDTANPLLEVQVLEEDLNSLCPSYVGHPGMISQTRCHRPYPRLRPGD